MTEERNIKNILAEVAAQAEESRDEITKMYRSNRPATQPSQVYSIRIPVSRLGRIRALATKYGMAPTVMLRTWILERLDAEERSPGKPSRGYHVITPLGQPPNSGAGILVLPHVLVERRSSPSVYEHKFRECTSERNPRMAEL